jgi:protein TonB
MFRTLLESQAMPVRRAGGTLLSVALHTGVIALAIAATARATLAPPRLAQESTDVVYAQPPLPRHTHQDVPDHRGAFPVIRHDILDGFPVSPIVLSPAPSFSVLKEFPGPDDFPTIALARSAPGEGPGFPQHLSGPSDGVFDAVMVDKAAAARPGNPAPVYPPGLRSAQLEGSVVARFIVDTTGRAEPASIQFPEATDPAFADAVRQALLRSRYLPAVLSGQLVRQLVEQRFSFALAR